jgi:DNA-binding transcriptional LysR family regulator
LNLRFVEAFYWVASLKSVTRAAEKLFLTQSAMSSRIAALEEELGVLLLDRRDKQFRLTVAGLRFFSYAQRLLEMQREIKAEMGAGAPQAMALRLGAIESVLHSWLIPMVELLQAEHPGLELEMTVETTPVLLDQIRRGALDLIFAALPASGDGLRSRALPPMDMVFVANAKQLRRRRYKLSDLTDVDILTFQRGSQPHVALVDLFRQKKVEPKRVHTISSISAMTQLVEGGFGIATLPVAAAKRLIPHRNLKLLQCDTPLQPLPVYATFRADPTSHAIETVVNKVFEYIDQLEPAQGGRGRRPAKAAQGKRASPGGASKKSMN